MDKEYVMRVAATIREQLVTMTDTPVLMSWGIGEFMATVFNDLPATEIPCKRKTLPRGSADLSERLGLL